MLERAARHLDVRNLGVAAVAFNNGLRMNPERYLDEQLRLQMQTPRALETLAGGTSNDERVRMCALSKVIFAREWALMEGLQKQANMGIDALVDTTWVAFAEGYMTNAGAYEWERYKKHVLALMREVAERAAVVVAVAGPVVAVPPPDVAMG
jgi:hypothetical protein